MMIYEVTCNGPWIDLDSVVAICRFSTFLRIIFFGGDQLDIADDDESRQALIDAWRAHVEDQGDDDQDGDEDE